jgi:hypothetical protein
MLAEDGEQGLAAALASGDTIDAFAIHGSSSMQFS